MAGRPPLLDPDELVLRISRSAAEVFAEKGFSASTIDEIVRRANISKPALYRAFSSKSHLYSALIEMYALETAQVALSALVGSSGVIEKRLPIMIDAWFGHVEKHPDLFRLLHRDVPDDPLVQATAMRIRTLQVANDIALLRQFAPNVPDEEVEPLGEVLRAALAAIATWWLRNPIVERRVPVAAMVRVCLGLLDVELNAELSSGAEGS